MSVCPDCGRLVPAGDLDTHRAVHDNEVEQARPTPAGDGLPPLADRFTLGLMIDVAKVIEQHGYPTIDGRAFVELQQHLLHFLHGRDRGDDRCYGGAR